MSFKFHLKDKFSLLVRSYALLGVSLLTSSRIPIADVSFRDFEVKQNL